MKSVRKKRDAGPVPSNIVMIHGLRFKRENGYLVLDEVIDPDSTIGRGFHGYSRKQRGL